MGEAYANKKIYTNQFRKKICTKICIKKQSTSYIANKYQVNLKTVENWVTRFNKDQTCFDKPDNYYGSIRKKDAGRYDSYTKEILIKELKSRDTEIELLKAMIECMKLR